MEAGMKTVLYLMHHGATETNLTGPPVLQGRRYNPPLAPLGIRQAEATRDFLAIRPMDRCYSSPLQRALDTAAIVAAPHGLSPIPLEALMECDVGRWEGLDWQTIRSRDGEAYRRFMEDPANHGYPEGESLADVYRRVQPALEELLSRHAGDTILVLSHRTVNRAYLAGLLGLTPDQARHVSQDNCGISVVIREGAETTVSTVNAAFHLQGVAA
jgi:broad specificity phosphatase PhoE